MKGSEAMNMVLKRENLLFHSKTILKSKKVGSILFCFLVLNTIQYPTKQANGIAHALMTHPSNFHLPSHKIRISEKYPKSRNQIRYSSGVQTQRIPYTFTIHMASSDKSNVNTGSNSKLDTPSRNQNPESSEIDQIKRENEFLKQQIQELTDENKRLEKGIETSTLVLESFEGENARRQYDASGNPILKWFEDETDVGQDDFKILQIDDEGGPNSRANKPPDCETDLFGEEYCPVEPDVSFGDALRDRAYWLVGLLALQSCSGFILANNELLLQKHPVIVYFLTMLVGAGGNAGNQASVRGEILLRTRITCF